MSVGIILVDEDSLSTEKTLMIEIKILSKNKLPKLFIKKNNSVITSGIYEKLGEIHSKRYSRMFKTNKKILEYQYLIIEDSGRF